MIEQDSIEYKCDMAVRDAWLSITELSYLFKNLHARQFIIEQAHELWSAKTKLDLLLSAIEAITQPEAA